MQHLRSFTSSCFNVYSKFDGYDEINQFDSISNEFLKKTTEFWSKEFRVKTSIILFKWQKIVDSTEGDDKFNFELDLVPQGCVFYLTLL